MSKTRRTPGIRVSVHWHCIWINGDALAGLSTPSLKRLVKILLDAGVPVRGYWRDADYKSIDPRISSKGGRV